jgi:hypothetical protein
VVDKNGKEISGWVTAYKNFLLTINNYQLLLIVNYLMQPSVFLSRKAYEKAGPFEGYKNFVMEYATWLKLGKVQMPKVIPNVLTSFRMSGENISSTRFNELLAKDVEIVRQYTNNPLLLFLHTLNNSGRRFIVGRL